MSVHWTVVTFYALLLLQGSLAHASENPLCRGPYHAVVPREFNDAELFQLFQLFQESRSGNQVSANTLARFLTGRLRPVIRNMVGEEHADDVLSDVFVRIWGHPLMRTAERFTLPYLITMAQNTSTNFLRGESRRRARGHGGEPGEPDLQLDSLPAPVVASPLQNLVQESGLLALRAAIPRLPERQRRVVEMKLEGMSNAAIAASLGTTVVAVKLLYTRALQNLRTHLAD